MSLSAAAEQVAQFVRDESKSAGGLVLEQDHDQQQPQEMEEALHMLQHLWSRRNTLSRPLLPQQDSALLDDLLPATPEPEAPSKPQTCLQQQQPTALIPPRASTALHTPRQPSAVLDTTSTEDNDIKQVEQQWVDAGSLGEVPARYAISGLRSHEMAVVGAYIDTRVVPGFRYRVRTLGMLSRSLFQGRALTLLSIGRGYGRRLTFEAGEGMLNCNPNYFWSDSEPEGFALELEAVFPGDKFTVMDANHVAAGHLELLHTQGPQIEVSGPSAARTARITGEKAIRVRALCRVEWFESGEEQVVPMAGLALVRPNQGGREAPPGPRFVQVALGVGLHLRGFSLLPGSGERRVTLRGEVIGDVPTSYTVTGLESHEMPVIGTYVDPRIAVGFHYHVRRLGETSGRRELFGGRALCLLSVGAGYAKRLSFEPDNFNSPQNYFWSDSGHGEGFALEIRGVFAGQRFWVNAAGERVGEASVFRADCSQSEESSERLLDGSLLKQVRIEVTCHVSLDGASTQNQAMRVSGTAVLLRPPLAKGGQQTPPAKLLRVENVGLDSNLNPLFVRESAAVVLYPQDLK